MIGFPYRKGYRAEMKARAELAAKGYFVVTSRGSHGDVDLVAFPTEDCAPGNRDLIRLIQVKAGRKPVLSDRQRMTALAEKLVGRHVLCEIWWYADRELHSEWAVRL